jgi:D-alanyl-D-alanine carboxypeptidase (penicillin-binding protein 5/6)
VRRLALLLLALLVALSPSAAAKSPRSPLATDVTASAAILVDETTGDVLWGKEIHARRYVASTTKIMTVIIAMEHLRPHDVVTVDRSVRRVPPITEGLRPGEKVEAWKLFYGALLYSGNDTALALAIGVAGTRSKFVALMNEKAKSIGLNHTHFRSPSGLLDKDNYSTAADMAALARYAMANPRFRAVVRTRVKHVPWPGIGEKIYENKNHLIGAYPGANGVKTGWTTLAKHCLVASVKRNGVSLVAVILGADDMYADVKKLFAYGFATRG